MTKQEEKAVFDLALSWDLPGVTKTNRKWLHERLLFHAVCDVARYFFETADVILCSIMYFFIYSAVVQNIMHLLHIAHMKYLFLCIDLLFILFQQ